MFPKTTKIIGYNTWGYRINTKLRWTRWSLFKNRLRNGVIKARTIASIVIVVYVIIEPTAAYAQTPDPGSSPAFELNVESEQDLLTIKARRAPWQQVFDEITRKTGAQFRTGTSRVGSVTVTIKSLPFRDAIQRLLGPQESFMCRYDGVAAPLGIKPGIPREVWLLGGKKIAQSEGPMKETTENKDVASILNDASNRNLVQNAAGEEISELTKESQSTRPEISELVEQAQNEDSSQRIQAISALGDRELTDEVVSAALRTALEDDDASIRGQAFQSLVMRGGDEATEYIGRALNDSDPNVRIVAVEYVEPNNHGISILQEALGDSDETVRSLAASRLNEASGQSEIGE